jgi:putative ABC transport system substrate-binding protein
MQPMVASQRTAPTSGYFPSTAGYVDRILHGAKPGDLPIEEASKFDFVVNLHPAQKLGMSLSPDFLVIANQVIE